MLDPNNFESTEKLSPDALLEKGSEYQVEIDGLEADIEDLRAKSKGKKESLGRYQGQIAKIFHARESGSDLYLLKDGGLTEEAPDLEGSLPLGDSPELQPEEPQDDELPLGDVPEEKGQADPFYPAQQAGQVYQAKSTVGNTLTVKESVRGWTGRVSGKPVAIDCASSAEAMSHTEDHLKEEFVLEWKPTIEITEITEDDCEGEDEAVGIDL